MTNKSKQILRKKDNYSYVSKTENLFDIKIEFLCLNIRTFGLLQDGCNFLKK